MREGYALLMSVVVIGLILFTLLVLVQTSVLEARLKLYSEQSRLESEIIARSCMSRAIARYANGLRIFPKKFFIGQGTCDFLSASQLNNIITISVSGKSGNYIGTIISARYSATSLDLLSYSF